MFALKTVLLNYFLLFPPRKKKTLQHSEPRLYIVEFVYKTCMRFIRCNKLINVKENHLAVLTVLATGRHTHTLFFIFFVQY